MSYTNGLDNPQLYFQTKLYTGDGNSTQAITLDGDENMQPDWIWIKNRTDGHYSNLNDSVRGVGATKVLRSNTNGAEGGTSGHVSVIGSNGFTVAAGTSDSEEVNTSSDNYVAWNWKAGTSFSNDASATSVGTIDSSGSVSDVSGFSICSFTGTGSNGTIKHGLSTAPKMIIFKQRNGSGYWLTYHASIGAGTILRLDTTDAKSDSSVWFQNTDPTSSVFSVGTSSNNNGSSNTYIAYCLAEKKGYSKFGSYTGNGNADGPFVYLGFRPAWVLVKLSSGVDDWQILDNKRSPHNIVGGYLRPNSSGVTVDNDVIDFTSNGFKLRTSAGSWNPSGGTFIYMAFAESPLVNSNGVPATAR